jgi:hypothetical protein
VIGLNTSYANVEGVGALKHAEDDATAVAATLERQGWEKPVAALIGAAAIRSSILNALVRLARDSRPEDTVLIYFAGHGVSAKWAEGKKPHTYWIAADTTLGLLEKDGLRLEHIMDYVDDIPANKKVVILDHCHSGTVKLPASAAGGGRDAGDGTLKLARDLSLPEDLPKQLEDRAGSGVLVVGAASDVAYELATLKHGLLTFALLQALESDAADKPPAGNGDKQLSTTELADYLEDQMKLLAPQNNVKQTMIAIVGGNLRKFNVTTLTQTPDEAEAKLLSTVGRLARNGMDPATENACTLAVQGWAEARRKGVEPTQKDREIVQRLQALQDQGPGVNWANEARKMPGFISGPQ